MSWLSPSRAGRPSVALRRREKEEPNTMSSPSVVLRRAAIDSETLALRARIDSLNAERNSLAQITVLPNEMLVEIFSAVKALSFGPSPLTRLMRVCRLWYSIINACHGLWTNIVCASFVRPERILAAQLLRSGLAPVRIHIPIFDSYVYAPLIVPHTTRIQALRLSGSGDAIDLLEFVQDMTELEFPTLQSLSLALGDRPELDRQLPRALLDGRLPRLKNLDLTYMSAPWELLPPLQSLRLHRKAESPPSTLTLDLLLTFLQSSPGLRTLHLDLMLQPGSPASSHRPALPRLELLYLCERLSSCEVLLDRLTFPASAQVQLLPFHISSGADIRPILIPLHKHLRARTPPATALSIYSKPSSDDNYQSLLIDLYPDARPTFRDDALFTIIAHPTGMPALRQVLAKVLKAIPMQSVTHLAAGNAFLTAATWKAALALMPALESVNLDVNAAGTGFCEAAMAARLMPRRIAVSAMTFADLDEPTVKLFFTTLLRLLRVCDGAGKRVGRLLVTDHFRKLAITDAREAEFKSLVDEVVIDAAWPSG
ncbi:hypothetical protein C8R46DRAFT_1362525 [Mycena filopes]|nr:hypothetical protein C8R46DRAFT_1362525 [Mycena filopes]